MDFNSCNELYVSIFICLKSSYKIANVSSSPYMLQFEVVWVFRVSALHEEILVTLVVIL